MNSNMLDFVVRMKDLMSSGLSKLAANAHKTFAGIDKNIQQTNKTVTDLSQQVRGVTDRVRDFGATPPNNGPGDMFQRTTEKVKNLNNELKKTKKIAGGGAATKSEAGGIKGNGNGLMGLVRRYIAPLAVAGALMSFGSSSIHKATDFEATNKTYEVLTGSKAKGRGLAGDLNKLQQDTILGPEVFKSGQTLLGFGIAAEKVVPTIKMLGDIAMGDAERFNALTLAFAQMTAAGRLQGQDLLQFVNAGFNPLMVMSKQTGKSMMQLRKEMEKGGISSAMVTKAFEAATSKGGQFNDMMNQMAETTKGKVAMMQGQIDNSMIAIGGRLKVVTELWMEMKASVLGMLAPHTRLQDNIISEKASLNTLVGAITSQNTANDVRLTLLNKLKTSYPDLFGKIDTEKIKNSELLSILEKINNAYDRRIGVAVAQNNVDELQSKANKQYDDLATYIQLSQKLGGDHADDISKKDLEYRLTLIKLQQSKNANTSVQHVATIEDTMKWFNDGAFKTKEKFKNKKIITGILQKVSGGKATEDDYAVLKSLMQGKVNASNIKGGDSTAIESKGKSVASGITGGGPRVINIHGVNMKLADKIEVHASDGKAFIADMEPKMEDMFLRLLNSGAAVQ